MARKRRNRNSKSNGSVSSAGIVYFLKHIGGLVMKQNGNGQPVSEISKKNWGQATKAFYTNVENANLLQMATDGLIIGGIRKLGLSVNIMKLGNTNIRSI